MTRDEVKEVMQVIVATYPNFKPDNMSQTIDAWSWILSDMDANAIRLALKTYIKTSNSSFAPSVAELIAYTQKAQEMAEIGELEAWSIVSKGLRNGVYGAEKEFDAFPDEIKEAVGSPDNLRNWAQTDQESVENVIQSNFLRAYRTVLKRRGERALAPAEIKNMLPTKEYPVYQIEAQDRPSEKVVNDVRMEEIRERISRLFEE